MSKEEAGVLRRLIYEPTTYPVNGGYRKSFVRSLVTVAYLYVKSLRCESRDRINLLATAQCFGVFKNELIALDSAIAQNPRWHKIPVSLQNLDGLDWRGVFRPAILQLPGFLWRVFVLSGWAAIRDFAYPFIGYLVFMHLQVEFRKLIRKPLIVTTNLLHPLSVGIHLAARQAKLPTIFWEHAITPRIVARDMGYDEYYVKCSHTRLSFIEAGVEESQVKLIEPSVGMLPAPLADTSLLVRIGVSVNDLDDLTHVNQLVSLLLRLGRECVLRVHDSDKRLYELAGLAEKLEIRLSNAAHSCITEFMREVDLIIAGNSNVVLDCLRAGTRVIYYWPGDPMLFDYNGIVAASGCDHATSLTELSTKLGGLKDAASPSDAHPINPYHYRV